MILIDDYEFGFLFTAKFLTDLVVIGRLSGSLIEKSHVGGLWSVTNFDRRDMT